MAHRRGDTLYKVLKCQIGCGGKKCKYCGNFDLWVRKKNQHMAINGLFSNWATDNIVAMQRPSSRLIREYDIISQFKKNNIFSIFNLEEYGEHPACGDGIIPESGFSYSPEEFMDHGISYFNFGWTDMATPPFPYMLDIMHVLKKCLQRGNVAIHCHAGLGRTGIVICCYLVYTNAYTPLEAIEHVRLHRPRSVQTRGQVRFVKAFAVFLARLRLLFPHQLDDTLCYLEYLARQQKLLHGPERRRLKLLPKVLDVALTMLEDIHQEHTASFCSATGSSDNPDLVWTVSDSFFHPLSQAQLLVLHQYKVLLNKDQWDCLHTHVDPAFLQFRAPILSRLCIDWLRSLRVPLFSDEDVERLAGFVETDWGQLQEAHTLPDPVLPPHQRVSLFRIISFVRAICTHPATATAPMQQENKPQKTQQLEKNLCYTFAIALHRPNDSFAMKTCRIPLFDPTAPTLMQSAASLSFAGKFQLESLVKGRTKQLGDFLFQALPIWTVAPCISPKTFFKESVVEEVVNIPSEPPAHADGSVRCFSSEAAKDRCVEAVIESQLSHRYPLSATLSPPLPGSAKIPDENAHPPLFPLVPTPKKMINIDNAEDNVMHENDSENEYYLHAHVKGDAVMVSSPLAPSSPTSPHPPQKVPRLSFPLRVVPAPLDTPTKHHPFPDDADIPEDFADILQTPKGDCMGDSSPEEIGWIGEIDDWSWGDELESILGPELQLSTEDLRQPQTVRQLFFVGEEENLDENSELGLSLFQADFNALDSTLLSGSVDDSILFPTTSADPGGGRAAGLSRLSSLSRSLSLTSFEHLSQTHDPPLAAPLQTTLTHTLTPHWNTHAPTQFHSSSPGKFFTPSKAVHLRLLAASSRSGIYPHTHAFNDNGSYQKSRSSTSHKNGYNSSIVNPDDNDMSERNEINRHDLRSHGSSPFLSPPRSSVSSPESPVVLTPHKSLNLGRIRELTRTQSQFSTPLDDADEKVVMMEENQYFYGSLLVKSFSFPSFFPEKTAETVSFLPASLNINASASPQSKQTGRPNSSLLGVGGQSDECERPVDSVMLPRRLLLAESTPPHSHSPTPGLSSASPPPLLPLSPKQAFVDRSRSSTPSPPRSRDGSPDP